MRKSSEKVSTARGWIVSRDGLQKLGLALIGPFVVLFAFSGFQLIQFFDWLDQRPVKILQDRYDALSLSYEGLKTIVNIMNHASERSEILKTAFQIELTIQEQPYDLGGEIQIQADDLVNEISQQLFVVSDDLGRLDRFTSGNYHQFWGDTAQALVKRLEQEVVTWTAIHRMLKTLADRGSFSGELRAQVQRAEDENLAFIQSVSSLVARMEMARDSWFESSDKAGLETMKDTAEVETRTRNMKIYLGLLMVAFLGSMLSAAGILRPRRVKPEAPVQR